MGTIGGNLCLETRCTYYDQNYEWRKAIGFCMKQDGGTCWVATSSPKCLAVSSTDTAPMLQALGATVTLVSAGGTRVLPVAELYANDGMRYLTRRPDEILTTITLPPNDGWRSAYLPRDAALPRRIRARALLAPFDPLVWDRRRFAHLHDWDYRFEAYTPASRRRFGYSALPLLWRDRVIGWANVARKQGGLDIQTGFAAHAPRARAFTRALDIEMQRLETFLAVPAEAP